MLDVNQRLMTKFVICWHTVSYCIVVEANEEKGSLSIYSFSQGWHSASSQEAEYQWSTQDGVLPAHRKCTSERTYKKSSLLFSSDAKTCRWAIEQKHYIFLLNIIIKIIMKLLNIFKNKSPQAPWRQEDSSTRSTKREHTQPAIKRELQSINDRLNKECPLPVVTNEQVHTSIYYI